jgi:hypothetical protein
MRARTYCLAIGRGPREVRTPTGDDTMRSIILAIIAALAFAPASLAATCRNHVTGKLRLCAPLVARHPVVHHRPI